jgi:hypothetical protein
MQDKIKTIFEENTIDDLNRFLKKRQCLNTANSYLIYLFHLIQSAGILLTSFAVGNNNQELIWIGVSCNILASLINVYEKTNNNILRRLMADIKLIKDGKYIDESEMVDVEKNEGEDSENNTRENKNNSTAKL